MHRVAIVLARGGSKRLPRKNIRPFHGRPILYYPVNAAIKCGLFDEVIVSTDDEEIAAIAGAVGCNTVIKRPEMLANDTATTAQAMRHAVQFLTDHGAALEHVCCLYPCTPMVRYQDLLEGFERLIESGKAYVFSIARYAPDIHRALMRWDDGSVRPVWAQFRNTPTQDLEPRYYDAGQWYWGTAAAWLNEVPIHDSWSIGHLLPRERAIDIDTQADWDLAWAVYALEQQKRASPTADPRGECCGQVGTEQAGGYCADCPLLAGAKGGS